MVGGKGLNAEGKLDISLNPASQPLKQPSLSCPECDSKKLWKSGFRVLTNGSEVQRWLCRDCGYRFSEKKSQDLSFNPLKPLKEPSKKLLNSSYSINNECQVCGALTRGTKNLTKVESRTRERAAGATTQTADIKGKVIEFAWWLKKRGCSETTITVWASTLKSLATLGANLLDPESVKATIAGAKCLKFRVGEPWSESRKQAAVTAYTAFLKMQAKTWERPKYNATRKLPFIPTEQELDALIVGCGKKTASFLQLLKETGMRCGEAIRLKWIDVDLERRIITLNSPEKRGNPRMFKVSNRLLSMLSALPKVSEKVFPVAKPSYVRTTYYASRKRLARKLQNPRLMRISFHTFRHWKATMLYHKTRDILYVKEFLGHKNLDTTLLYIQIEKVLFKETSDEFTVKVANEPEKIKTLLEVGFEYVCQKDGLIFLRKRK